MILEYTFSMIKPDALQRRIIGKVENFFEKAGLKIVAQKMIKLTKAQAEEFYAEHKERPFFESLITYMTSGPVIVQVLKGQGAIKLNREIMGATDPKNAEVGTVRGEYGQSIEHNTVHGSDSAESAKREIEFFFSKDEILE